MNDQRLPLTCDRCGHHFTHALEAWDIAQGAARAQCPSCNHPSELTADHLLATTNLDPHSRAILLAHRVTDRCLAKAKTANPSQDPNTQHRQAYATACGHLATLFADLFSTLPRSDQQDYLRGSEDVSEINDSLQ
jgi:hypothetical protein